MAAPINLRDKILSVDDIKKEILHVDQWDVDLEIRSLNGKARSKLMNETMKSNGKMDMERLYPELIISCTYDPETHERVFQPTDREQINTKNSGALEKIAKVAMKLSGLDADSVEQAEKN